MRYKSYSKSYIKHENTQTIQQHTYHQKIHENINAPSNRISTHNVGHICRKIIDGLRDKSFGSVIEKCEKVTGATKVTQQCQDYGAQCTLIHGYIKSPNMNFVFLLQSMPYDIKIGPH